MDKFELIEEKVNHVEHDNNLMLEFYKTMLKEKNEEKKRWFIVCIIELIIILGMFAGFLIYESQFEYETETTLEQMQFDVENSQQSGVIE